MAREKDKQHIIKVENLRKTYTTIIKPKIIGEEKKKITVALNDVSFSVAEGDFIGLLGPNGSGKTTLIKILTGVLVPDSGEVKVNNFIPWKREKDYLKSIGVMFGNRTGLLFDLPVRDSFELNKIIYEIDEEEYKKRLEKISKLLGLRNLLDMPVRKLSFGQRMRAEIGLIFLHNPKIVFMDEPTLGFDIIVKSKIYEFLKRINKEEKTTIILSSHIISDVEKLCKEVIILNKGRLVWNGKITALPKIFGNLKEISFTFKKIKNLEKFKVFMKNYKPSIWDDKVSLLINEEKEKYVLSHISEIFETSSFEMKNPDLEALLSKIYKSKMKISKQN